MSNSNINLDRRKALKLGIFAATAGVATNAVAQAICKTTPVQPEGPFYPVDDQPDKDTDLVTLRGSSQLAKGQIIIVQGIVENCDRGPIEGVLVEIWQACASGKYNHRSDPNPAPLDPNFQYWGKAVTNARGEYRFRTIVPGAYPADEGWVRPPHIHFKVQKRGFMELITQMYFAGDVLNKSDRILSRLKLEDQKKVIVPLVPTEDLPYPVATFNITLERP